MLFERQRQSGVEKLKIFPFWPFKETSVPLLPSDLQVMVFLLSEFGSQFLLTLSYYSLSVNRSGSRNILSA